MHLKVTNLRMLNWLDKSFYKKFFSFLLEQLIYINEASLYRKLTNEDESHGPNIKTTIQYKKLIIL